MTQEQSSEKPCGRCGEITKFPEGFFRDSSKPSGYHSVCKVCDRARSAAWKVNNRKRSRRINKASRERNREAAIAATKRWYEANREYAMAEARKWQAANPEKFAEIQRKNEHKRRAQKLKLPCEDVIHAVVFKRDEGVCGICGDPVDPGNWHLDHIMPLARGGHHLYSNVQVSHPSCNQRKGAKCPTEFQLPVVRASA